MNTTIELRTRRRVPSIQLPIPTLQWWVWMRGIGIVSLVGILAFYWAGGRVTPAILAAALHLVADFTQSEEVAMRKGERGRHLLVHALVAGGLPLAIAGLSTGNPATVLVWTAAGVVGHYATDWTRKFGLKQAVLGAVLDQAIHLATILALAGHGSIREGVR